MSAPFHAETIAVDPARLAPGTWCHHAGKQLGEGDIHASYSADRIGMDSAIRTPFRWQGGLWICTSIRGGERIEAEAYRLVHPQQFAGTPISYAEKTRNGDAARSDPNGFYHGMMVRHAGADRVLSGPPTRFIPGEAVQFSLF